MQFLDVPGSVKVIGNDAFCGCDALESATLRKGLKQIGQFAFGWCTSLEKMDVPGTVEVIREVAFFGCASLKHVLIPSTISFYSEDVLENCKNLQAVGIKGNSHTLGLAFLLYKLYPQETCYTQLFGKYTQGPFQKNEVLFRLTKDDDKDNALQNLQTIYIDWIVTQMLGGSRKQKQKFSFIENVAMA